MSFFSELFGIDDLKNELDARLNGIQLGVNKLLGSLPPVVVSPTDPAPVDPTPVDPVVPAPVHASVPTDGKTNLFSGLKPSDLYVNPDSVVAKYVKANPSDSDIAILRKVASVSTANWITNPDPSDVYDTVKKIALAANGKFFTLVGYLINGRDNGKYSSGGAATPDIAFGCYGAMDAALKDAGNPRCAIILEPDAGSYAMQDQNTTSRGARFGILKTFVDILSQNPNRAIYLDMGMWTNAADSNAVTQYVKDFTAYMGYAGMKNLRGIALDTSGFNADADVQKFGDAIFSVTGMNYVSDTSRNGAGAYHGGDGYLNGSDPEVWCNPPGRLVGAVPLTQSNPHQDANLWVKPVGESDGTCRGGPQAGQFYKSLLLDMTKNF